MVDGLSGTDLMVQLLDDDRHPADPPSEVEWTPAPEPSALRLAVGGAVDVLGIPARQFAAVGGL